MKIIVIGHGMVGHKFLESLAETGAPGAEVTVLCEEPRPAYDRVHLSEFFAGKSADDLSLVEPGFFERSDVQLRLNARAVGGGPRRERTVTAADGEVLRLRQAGVRHRLLPLRAAAAGQGPQGLLRLPHHRRPGSDARMRRARRSTGVVIGGGLLGLECAKALRDMGLETHVVEFAPRLMAVQVDDGGARVLRARIEELGVHRAHQKNTLEIVDGEDGTPPHACSPTAATSTTDMIVFSAGIRPRDELARAVRAGHRPARRHRHRQQLPAPATRDVYAIGECAAWNGRRFGLVAPGYDMARVAARHLARRDRAAFIGADMSTKLKLMGVDVASIGDAHGRTPQAAAPTSSSTSASRSTRRSSSPSAASTCWAPCWWATPPNTARCCR